jgi:hypothetical protein
MTTKAIEIHGQLVEVKVIACNDKPKQLIRSTAKAKWRQRVPLESMTKEERECDRQKLLLNEGETPRQSNKPAKKQHWHKQERASQWKIQQERIQTAKEKRDLRTWNEPN